MYLLGDDTKKGWPTHPKSTIEKEKRNLKKKQGKIAAAQYAQERRQENQVAWHASKKEYLKTKDTK